MELRRARRRARFVNPQIELPPGQFPILLADPPWQYDFVEADNRAIENQYPTLSAEDIVGLKDAAGRAVSDVATEDAVLFLWATNPKLSEALTVIDGWGFTYLTNLVWVKDKIGMGYWARQRHELLLVAKRGDFPPPPENMRPDSVIMASRAGHSVKPPDVQLIIEAIWPELPKVELFARSGREGWARSATSYDDYDFTERHDGATRRSSIACS